jgi:hypothetical protein
MPTVYFHGGQMWAMAREARDRAISAVQANSENPPQDAIVAILLSVSSMEAFINELAEWVVLNREDPSVSADLLGFGEALREVENNRGSLELKYLIASQTLAGRMYDKGANPYQDFAILAKLRNDIVHLKARQIPDQKEGKPPETGLPKYILSLQQRGFARVLDEEVIGSWFDLIKTQEMAVWACQASLDMILSVLAMIPDDPIPARDPTETFKQLFRAFSSTQRQLAVCRPPR